MDNIFGKHDEDTIEQFKTVESYSVRAALMADGHKGYVMPVGGVAAFDNKVSVVGVGFDIACGNCAIKTNLKLADVTKGLFTLDDLKNNPYAISQDTMLNKFADQIASTISFGIGRSNLANNAPVDHPLFIAPEWNIIPNTGRYRDDLRDKARKQLGTVGSGNHYVDVFVDLHNNIWVGVHFGSRGFGHTIASNFLAIGQGGTWGDKGREVETLLDLSTPSGQDYWALMSLAGDYAYAGREWVARTVMTILGGTELDMVHNHHNFAWKEQHEVNESYQELIVVRKGATPAFPGQRGFVGGSMGDDAVILQGSTDWSAPEGTSVPYLQNATLNSTVHGAGRVMSRNEAAGKWDRKRKYRKSPGKISPEMMKRWLDERGVVLRGGDLDEAPQAYRRLPEVLKAQGQTIQVLETLRPVIVVMAGHGEFDPYKD